MSNKIDKIFSSIKNNFKNKDYLFYIERELIFMGISYKMNKDWYGWVQLLPIIKRIKSDFYYDKQERLSNTDLKSINKLVNESTYLFSTAKEFYEKRYEDMKLEKLKDPMNRDIFIASIFTNNIKAVYTMQQILKDVGYSVEEDGIIGNLTIQALNEAKRFSINSKNVKRSYHIIKRLYMLNMVGEVKKLYDLNGVIRYIKLAEEIEGEFI